MSRTTLLDYDALLSPIPGDDPAGKAISFSQREQLEEGRKEERPDGFNPGDPQHPAPFKTAAWAGVIDLTQELLKTTSKDLLLAARLTEALVHEYGFAGLREGLHLLNGLITHCWDRLYPPLTNSEDLEIRASPFHWLDDPYRGACFPSTLRLVPLVADEKRTYSWTDWHLGQQGRGPVNHQTFGKAVWATPWAHCDATAKDLEDCRRELLSLSGTLQERMGDAAPGLNELVKAVMDCQHLVQEILQRKSPPQGSVSEFHSESPNSDEQALRQQETAEFGNYNPMAIRSELYRQLEQVALTLQQLEPHSPIPYLLFRAVQLGNLPFPQLMKELIRDLNILKDMYRELGIVDENPGKK